MPLRTGVHSGRVFAFKWVSSGSEAIVVVARLTSTVGDIPVGKAWDDTRVDTGEANGQEWCCSMHGESTQVDAREGLSVSNLFRVLPVAVLTR